MSHTTSDFVKPKDGDTMVDPTTGRKMVYREKTKTWEEVPESNKNTSKFGYDANGSPIEDLVCSH